MNQPARDDKKSLPIFDDPNWPRASDWLAGKFNSQSDKISTLGVVGAPVNSSLTPGRADLAPGAIRKILERFCIFDVPHNSDLRMIHVEDAGDLSATSMRPGDAVQPMSDIVGRFRKENRPVVILGGDNSITRAGVIALPYSLERCGVITFDAHFDLRDVDKGLNNGNPIRALLADGVLGMHIVQIGIQSFANSPAYGQVAREHNIHYVPVEQVFEDGIERTMRTAFEQLRDLDAIYFSLDMDVLDRAYAPACPGSRPGGLMPWQLRQMAYMCGSHYNVAAMDIVEIDPEKDVADVTLLSAGAALLSFASGLMERRERK